MIPSIIQLVVLLTVSPYQHYWPEDISLELKHVENCVLITIYVLCLTE